MIIIENERNRVVASGAAGTFTFESVHVDEWNGRSWRKILYWVCDEWREADSEAFEAILGVVHRVARNEPIHVPRRRRKCS